MEAADVTALTTAFAPAQFLDTFMLLAPYIATIVGVVIAINLVKWGVRTIRKRLSGGVA